MHDRPGDSASVDRLTAAAVGAATTAALLLSGVFAASGSVDSGVWRLIGVLIVIAVLCSLLVPLAGRISPHSQADHPGDPVQAVSATPAAAAEPAALDAQALRELGWATRSRPPGSG